MKTAYRTNSYPLLSHTDTTECCIYSLAKAVFPIDKINIPRFHDLSFKGYMNDNTKIYQLWYGWQAIDIKNNHQRMPSTPLETHWSKSFICPLKGLRG